MGSKGTSTQTQQSTYTPSPQVSAAGSQALSMAQGAASQPFQLPVAPVAGFTGDQNQAFQQTRNLQGMAQPYYNQAQGLFNQSAAPISGSQVNNYLNPYAGYVLGNLREQQGQQMNDLTGKATQAAGGVGADRIGVAQGELARQQSLATGQTLSGIYGSALSAAQQDAQRQQSAAYGIGQLGGASQNAALQGTNALYGMGSQQQQLNQAQLNAPYQNQLAQIAYPYQNAQYLAGITSNLAGAMGGTTNGTTNTTPAQPSIWSQVAGLGTGLAGAYGAFGGSGGNIFSNPSYGGGNALSGDAYGGSSQNPLSGLSPSDYGPGFASGGAATGGEPSWMTADPTVPTIEMHPSQVNQPKLAPVQQQSGGSGGGIGDAIGTIAKIAPLFLERGGSAYPHYADGGMTFDDRAQPTMEALSDGTFDASGLNGLDPKGGPLGFAGSNVPTPRPDPRKSLAFMANSEDDAIPDTAQPVSGTGGIPMPSAMENASPEAASVARANAADATPAANVPYKDLDHADLSRSLSRSPWMALMNAGFGMMAGTSPYAGVNIGQGLLKGTETLAKQREADKGEEELNQRAKQLALEADKVRRQYTQMTPAQAASAAYQNKHLQLMKDQLEQQGWQKGSDKLDGSSTWVNPRSGESGMLTADGKWVENGAAAPTPPVSAPTPAAEEKPPLGVPELASKNEAPVLPPPALPKSQQPIVSSQTKLIDTEIQKKATLLPDLENNLISMKSAYAKLMSGTDKDSFWTSLATQPGANFGERIERAKQANALATAAGKPPVIDPEKLAAAEEIAKIQQRMGAAFAAQISSRPAFAMEKIGINATPGVSNSPKGFLAIIPAFDAAVQNTKDQVQSWSDWQAKNPFRPNEWRANFMQSHTPDMYYARTTIENIPNPKIKEALPQAVEQLRKDAAEGGEKAARAVTAFNKIYGGTASYFLTGKMAPYEAAQ